MADSERNPSVLVNENNYIYYLVSISCSFLRLEFLDWHRAGTSILL